MTIDESINITNVVTYEMLKKFIDNTKANWSVDKLCLDLDYLSSYTNTWVTSNYKIEEDTMYITKDIVKSLIEIVIYATLDNVYRAKSVQELYEDVLTLLNDRHCITLNNKPDDVVIANYFQIAKHMLSNHVKLYIKDGINLAYTDIDIVYNPTMTPYIIHDIYFISTSINVMLVLQVVNNKG